MSVTRHERLRCWGIYPFADFRGAVIERAVITGRGYGRVVVQARRPSFTVECFDCGPSEHVAPDDDGSFAVCLHCGRDRWL